MFNFKREDLKELNHFDYDAVDRSQILFEISRVAIKQFGIKNVFSLAEKLKEKEHPNLDDECSFFLASHFLFESFTNHCKEVLNMLDSDIESIRDNLLIEDIIKKSFQDDK